MTSLFEIVAAPGCFVPRGQLPAVTADEGRLVSDGLAEWDRGECDSWGLRATLKGVCAFVKLCPGVVPGTEPAPPRPTVSELTDALIDARDAVISAATYAVEMAERRDPPDWVLDGAAGYVREAVNTHKAAQAALDAEVARDVDGEGA